jgi:hypothetical protein
MKNRFFNIILLALMAIMINACSQTPKKEPVSDPILESETIPEEAELIADPEIEAHKNRWSAGEMDR